MFRQAVRSISVSQAVVQRAETTLVNQTSKGRIYHRDPNDPSNIKETIKPCPLGCEDKHNHATEKSMKDTGDTVKEGLMGTMEKAKESGEEILEKTKNTLGNAKEWVKEKVIEK